MKTTIDKESKQFVQDMRETLKTVEPTIPKNKGPRDEKEIASAFSKGVDLMKENSKGIESIVKISEEV